MERIKKSLIASTMANHEIECHSSFLSDGREKWWSGNVCWKDMVWFYAYIHSCTHFLGRLFGKLYSINTTMKKEIQFLFPQHNIKLIAGTVTLHLLLCKRKSESRDSKKACWTYCEKHYFYSHDIEEK